VVVTLGTVDPALVIGALGDAVEPRGDGPVADVWASAEYLRSVLRGTR